MKGVDVGGGTGVLVGVVASDGSWTNPDHAVKAAFWQFSGGLGS
jgi:hypothetical protein